SGQSMCYQKRTTTLASDSHGLLNASGLSFGIRGLLTQLTELKLREVSASVGAIARPTSKFRETWHALSVA
ncbi:MAG: hypothetical protein OXK73_10285, partial [Rhodospirillaceae bacterium]|nr:hypothetical protein [Rhodospirillaceae bacterium]